MGNNLEDKLEELIRNSIKTFEASGDFTKNNKTNFDRFMIYEMEFRLSKLIKNGTIYDFNVQIETNKMICLYYTPSKASDIKVIKVKEYMREYKINKLLDGQ